jgi:hypothetical protein
LDDRDLAGRLGERERATDHFELAIDGGRLRAARCRCSTWRRSTSRVMASARWPMK